MEFIKGKAVALPIYSEVGGNGANAVYTIVALVPVRIMNVQLTGGNKSVTVQPAKMIVHETVVPSNRDGSNSYFFTPAKMLK